MFDRSSRFKGLKPTGPVMTYQNFSEYLRQQFLNSKNMFNPENSNHGRTENEHGTDGPETSDRATSKCRPLHTGRVHD